MTDLADDVGSSRLFVLSKLLEIGVSQVNVLDHHLLALAFDDVTDIVGVLGKDKDTRADELGDGTVDGEAETRDTGPEGL